MDKCGDHGMVSFGTELFGRVDYILCVGHVATRFWHLNGVPLIPLGSVFVTDEHELPSVDMFDRLFEQRRAIRGIRLGYYMRSVLLGWTEAVSRLGMVLGGIATFVLYVEALEHPALRLPLVVCAILVSVTVVIVLYRCTSLRMATEKRAAALLTRLPIAKTQMRCDSTSLNRATRKVRA